MSAVVSPAPRSDVALDDSGALAQAEAAFLESQPSYRETAVLDALRSSEYSRLDDCGEVYLDYTGASLFAVSQLEEHVRLLRGTVYGNPHSVNRTSSASTTFAQRARDAVLRYFNACDDDYVCIFTANATGALRLVREAYPFGPHARFLATFDNHNSVNGIRQFARAKGARTTYVPLEALDLRVAEGVLERELEEDRLGGHKLFAFPGQSNFSGVKHPLAWIGAAQERGWDVLLDAAALVPTNRLDLSAYRPDFVAISFYKLFGYPTGVGALLARRATLERLRRPWFSGWHRHRSQRQGEIAVPLRGHGRFEDGTVNYLALPAVEIGLCHIERIGIDTIAQRVQALGSWLLAALRNLRHADGSPATRIYDPATWDQRGPTIAFNFLRPDGSVVDERYVDAAAADHHISLRTGCFCNPGAGESAFSLSPTALLQAEFDKKKGLDEFIERIGMATGGAVRVSLGLATNFADVQRFITFAKGFCDLTALPEQLAPRRSC